MNTLNTFKINIFTRFLLLFTIVVSIGLGGCSAQVKKKEASNYNADLGIRYLQSGHLKLANEKLLKALDQNPNSAQSNHYFALLQQRLGSNKKAARHFTKAVKLDPKDPEIRNNYGSFLCRTNRPQAAVKQFMVAINDPLYSTPEFAYTNAGICLRKVNNHAQAETYFRNALKKKSSFPSALLEMAKLNYDKKNYPKAQAFMLRYEKVGKSSPEALFLCNSINLKTRNHAKASSCKSTLLRLFPNSKEAKKVH